MGLVAIVDRFPLAISVRLLWCRNLEVMPAGKQPCLDSDFTSEIHVKITADLIARSPQASRLHAYLVLEYFHFQPVFLMNSADNFQETTHVVFQCPEVHKEHHSNAPRREFLFRGTTQLIASRFSRSTTKPHQITLTKRLQLERPDLFLGVLLPSQRRHTLPVNTTS